MDENRKKLIQLRTQYNLLNNMDQKLDIVLNGELEISELCDQIYTDMVSTKKELNDLKFKMNLSDEEWDEDEL